KTTGSAARETRLATRRTSGSPSTSTSALSEPNLLLSPPHRITAARGGRDDGTGGTATLRLTPDLDHDRGAKGAVDRSGRACRGAWTGSREDGGQPLRVDGDPER